MKPNNTKIKTAFFFITQQNKFSVRISWNFRNYLTGANF